MQVQAGAELCQAQVQLEVVVEIGVEVEACHYQPGWDKKIYFVGANTFSQKFLLKQRESDATEDVQNSGNSGISSCDKKFLTVHEIFSFDKKFLSVTRRFFL